MTLHSITSGASTRTLLRNLVGVTVAGIALISASSSAHDYTDTKAYMVAVSPDYVVLPLLSVGDQVPNTRNPTQRYQMIGIPDGLGAYKTSGHRTILHMNHELVNTVLSEPNVGGTRHRGAFVSRWVLDRHARVLSGELAYDVVVDEELHLQLPPPQENNTTPGFARFCSGSLSWQEAGFDRPIFFSGEESNSPATFDGKGGLAVAIFDRELHTLPKLGRFPWENSLARPGNANSPTVIMCMEDGPTTPDNQLYMYVGPKIRTQGASAMNRNGLDTGKLYAFVSTTPGQTSEITFTSGSISGTWVEVPNADLLTDVQLEAATDAVGAFGFIRIEDGAWSKTNRNKFYFVTTGNGAGNRTGRGYHINFNQHNILGPATITMIYNGDTVDAAGGDIAFGPDNLDVSKDYMMINEDGHSDSRPKYASRGREGSIWRFDLRHDFARKRVAELNPPGTTIAPGQTAPPPVPVPGTWETSGIIDASDSFGRNSWLTVVQAHAPTLAPAPNTVEDGQLLLMLPSHSGEGDDDDHHDDD